ncbi:uncharacterized protein LOC116265842 [Nymphaea colorata]|uniref:uncharacterized protein LOC116265842 n=1 Tax=Nymphaea colorata TaxID=210225 RepID=UPI00129EB34B|nr:uncharacterized protein LOC116265842 [Nymphaea colorata]
MVSTDVVKAVRNFFSSRKIVKSVNETMICFIPKKGNSKKVDDYRPIPFCNTIYKIISKVIVNRLRTILERIINVNQAAFLKGRHIYDNILWVNETINSKDFWDKGGCCLKLDLLKAYDRVSWKFIANSMKFLDFYPRWIATIMQCITSARRGTINTIKVVLEDFERLAGMKTSEIQRILQWTNGKLPSEYLGLPMFLGRLTENLCLPLLTKVEKRLAAWKARLLSYAGRLCLIRYVLMTLPYYWTMRFRLPKVVIKKIQQACINFLWNDEEGARHMHLVKWDRMCMPVEEGGVGIRRLEEVNRAMPASRCCRLLLSGDPWANLLKEKYLRYHSLWTFKRATNQSWGWKGLRWGWTWIQDKVEWRIGNGECVRFWTDRWSRQILLTRADGSGYGLHGKELITSVQEFTSASQGSPSLDIAVHLGVFKDDIRLRDADDSLVWSDDGKDKFRAGNIMKKCRTQGVKKWWWKKIWNSSAPAKSCWHTYIACEGRLPTLDRLQKAGIQLANRCSAFVPRRPMVIS